MPYKGKELSMLIFLPNEMEDSTTGLEKVGREVHSLIYVFVCMYIRIFHSDLQLEKELTYENFVEWTQPDMMDNVDVSVWLPRFKMEEQYDLKEVLIGMGMADAFDASHSDFSGRTPLPNALHCVCVRLYSTCVFMEISSLLNPLAGMSPGNDLFLSQVVHKAFVDVNEEGTEAAAATVIMRLCAAPVFIADHPFLFFIRHNPSESILFAGRYCSPQ